MTQISEALMENISRRFNRFTRLTTRCRHFKLYAQETKSAKEDSLSVISDVDVVLVVRRCPRVHQWALQKERRIRKVLTTSQRCGAAVCVVIRGCCVPPVATCGGQRPRWCQRRYILAPHPQCVNVCMNEWSVKLWGPKPGFSYQIRFLFLIIPQSELEKKIIHLYRCVWTNTMISVPPQTSLWFHIYKQSEHSSNMIILPLFYILHVEFCMKTAS